MAAVADDLLEREDELARLRTLLAAARGGRGAVAIVEGPAGIGKTRLLGSARAQAAEDGMLVLRARGSELEGDFPFGVVRQLFEPAIADLDDETAFSGVATLARPLVDPSAHDLRGPAEDRFALLHGLYWLTVNLAEEHPLLVAVDDIQWLDPPSLEYLGYLLRRIDGLPVALLLALRRGESVDAGSPLAAITSERSAERVRPQPLSLGAVTALLAAAFAREPDSEFALACRDATSGNPLLLHELIAALQSTGTEPTAAFAPAVPEIGADAVAQFALGRLERLGGTAAALARAVAVLGDGATVDDAAMLAGVGRTEAADVAGELARSDLFRAGPPLAFAHPLIRAAVHATMAPSEREQLHARAAAVLDEAGAEPERVAVHLLHAAPGAVDGAAGTLREAARRSSAKAASDAAVLYLERALREPAEPAERATLLREAGAASLHASPKAAVSHLRAAMDAVGDPVERGETAALLGRSLYLAGQTVDAGDVLETALDDLPPGAVELRKRLQYELLMALAGSAELERVAEKVRRFTEGRDGTDGSRLGLALHAWRATFIDLAREPAVGYAAAAVADDGLLEHDNLEAYLSAAWTLVAADEYDLFEGAVTRAADWARSEGSMQGFTWTGYDRARRLLYLGRLAEAEAEARTVFDAVRSHGLAYGVPWFVSVLGDVLLERGQKEDAAAVLRDAGLAPRERGMNWLLVTRTTLHLAEGRAGDALADAEELRSRFAGGLENPSLPWRSAAAKALAAVGRHDEALELAAEEVEQARRWGAPRLLGHALRVAGNLHGGAHGLELLREASAVLAVSPALLERARTAAALGAATRRAGNRAEARDQLRQALELAHVCGARGLESDVRGELVVAGARPRRVMLRGVESLTASERRVAQLAASGSTNKEIAQTLFVTLKTVETHLARVYRKLGIGSRAQLAAALES